MENGDKAKPTKMKKLILSSVAMLAVLTMGASSKKVQCGVTNAQITTYLQECSHHHTVYSVWDVIGTCNSKASIENCKTSTIYVSEGIIIGHSDSGVGGC